MRSLHWFILLATILQLSPSSASIGADSAQSQLLGLTNGDRKSKGVAGSLSPDPILNMASQAHSSEMLVKGYFSHSSPDPSLRSGMQRYQKALEAGHQPMSAKISLGENIFKMQSTRRISIAAVMKQAEISFMKSPEHRRNILNRAWKSVGIGLAEGRNRKNQYVWLITVMFKN